jgi:hypothetical protein
MCWIETAVVAAYVIEAELEDYSVLVRRTL